MKPSYRGDFITVFCAGQYCEWIVYGSGVDWIARDASSVSRHHSRWCKWFAKREEAEDYAKLQVTQGDAWNPIG